MLAIIGGDPNRFRPYVDLYHRAFAQFGRVVREIGVHSHGYVAETDDKAREELWPDYKTMRDRIGAERGWPPMTRKQFDSEIEHGSLYVGAPETVARPDSHDSQSARYFTFSHEIQRWNAFT